MRRTLALRVLALLGCCVAAALAKHTPPVWPDEFQISWKLSLPYIAEYQPAGLEYTYEVWQDSVLGRQKMVRDGVETTLILVPEDHMYQVFPAGDELTCWLEKIHGGTGPTLASAAPAAPSSGGSGAAVSRRMLADESTSAKAAGSQLGWGKDPKSLLSFVLPDLTEERWEYKGLTDLDGEQLYLYEWDLTQGEDMEMTYRFYVDKDDKPVQLWQKGINLYSGGHRDIYISKFYDYQPGPLAAGTFDPPVGINCTDNELLQLGSHRGEVAAAAPPALRHGTLAHTFALHMPSVHHGDAHYDAFCHRHGRRHRHATQYAARAAEFHSSRKFVADWNSQPDRHRVGINHFADWSEEEYLALVRPNAGSRIAAADRPGVKVHEVTTPSHLLPAQVIWKGSPADSPVKDQAACGSCWSFSSVAAVEAALYRVSGMQTLLSEQDLIDCGWEAQTSLKGCYGGDQMDAFDYIFARGGVAAQADYPYRGVNDYCKKDVPRVNFTGNHVLVKGGEEAMKEALFTKGPMTVSVDASSSAFRFYTSGVFAEESCSMDPKNLDHAVVASGYGTTKDGRDYWLVKNIWSPYWGEDGYIRIQRNPNDCGIAEEPIYVELELKGDVGQRA